MTSHPDLLRETLDLALSYLESLPDRPVGSRTTVEELRRSLDVPLQDGEIDPGEVIRQLDRAALPGLTASSGPRYFGFVIGGTLPAALAADWLTSAYDQNAGIYATSPVASVIEEIASQWILQLLRLPSTASVGFVTGCQMANFTALAAARHGVLRRVGWDVEARGIVEAPRISILIGGDAHVTIHTSLRLLGFGTDAAQRIDTDDQGRMRTDRLAAALEGKSGPIIVCAQAGDVNSGAFDDLPGIGELCRKSGAWMHIDGAFGLWAASSPTRRSLVTGVELADSWATDGHKWLNVPYDNGIVIVADPLAHRGAMAVTAPYIEQASPSIRDPLEFVPEFSRRARGITIYAALRSLGRDGVAGLVDRCSGHAKRFATRLSKEPGVRILNDVVLNQVLVRFEGADPASSDALTRGVIRRVQQEGTCWLGGSTWRGEAAMRISVSGWMTSDDDVKRSAEAIIAAWRAEREGRY